MTTALTEARSLGTPSRESPPALRVPLGTKTQNHLWDQGKGMRKVNGCHFMFKDRKQRNYEF